MTQAPLKELLHHIAPLPDDVWPDVLARFQHLEYPKNYMLLKQGSICKYIWFMTKGAARSVHVDDEGRERNVWFSLDNDVITDAVSFVTEHPALESIQLLEDSELFAISYAAVQSLLQQHHAFALWYIRLIEQFYVPQIEDRVGELQMLTARQRYEKLLHQFPGITNRISLGHIASYLNITQESLSRIRSGKL